MAPNIYSPTQLLAIHPIVVTIDQTKLGVSQAAFAGKAMNGEAHQVAKYIWISGSKCLRVRL